MEEAKKLSSSCTFVVGHLAAAIFLLVQIRLCLSLNSVSLVFISAAAPAAAYIVSARVPPGLVRFLILSPFLPPLLLLPRAFPNSALLRTSLATSWLPFLHLLHLSFHHHHHLLPSSSFPLFAATLLSPVRLLRSSSSDSSSSSSSSRRPGQSHLLRFLVFSLPPSSFLLFFAHHRLPPFLTRPIYCLLTYFTLLLTHHLFSLLFRSTLPLFPPFHRPWLASSITDFWGSRWNLTAHSLLHQAIYQPLLRLLLLLCRPPASPSISRQKKPPLRARIPAVILTFLASGLFHEISYYGITQSDGLSGEALLFFLIHGVAASLEIYLRRTRPRHLLFRLPPPIRIILTLSFVVSTAVVLLYRPLDRSTPIHMECAAELRHHLAALARRLWRIDQRNANVDPDAHIDIIGLTRHIMPSIALN